MRDVRRCGVKGEFTLQTRVRCRGRRYVATGFERSVRFAVLRFQRYSTRLRVQMHENAIAGVNGYPSAEGRESL